MSNVVSFPCVNGAYASGSSMPGLTTPELRERAKSNFYTAERRRGVDPITAHARMEAFDRDLDRIAAIMKEKS